MTRKKTTTGTMGSKRKTTKSDKAPKSEASKVATPAESKASEVIAPVSIALLAAHPTLPDREDILLTFAAHYVESQARHVALAAQPEPEPEPVKPVGKKGRTPFQPPTLPSMRPVDLGHAPVNATHEDTLPDLQWDTATSAVAKADEVEPDAAFAETEESYLSHEGAGASEAYTEVLGVLEDEEPVALEGTEREESSEEDPFATLDASPAGVEDDADDFFARLQAQGEAALDGKSSMFEEVDFSAQHPSDQSSPFITSPLVAEAEADEGRTTMIAAFPDDEDELLASPPAVEPELEAEPEEAAAAFAEPNESTMMIAAITDDDIEAATAPSEDGAEAKPARKSRKSSKKKRA